MLEQMERYGAEVAGELSPETLEAGPDLNEAMIARVEAELQEEQDSAADELADLQRLLSDSEQDMSVEDRKAIQAEIDKLNKEKDSETSPKLEASKHWSSAEWLVELKKMGDEIFLAPDRKVFADILTTFSEIERQNSVAREDERSLDAPFKSVDTRLIVRAPSLADWSDSYHSARDETTYQRGENAVIEIARKISSLSQDGEQNDAALEMARIFSKDSFGVILKGYEGPRGPIYLVEDGSHRVAAAKLVGLDHVFARVGEQKDKQAAKKVWYEALALMPQEAREELRAVYDQVYPPTSEEKQVDEAAFINAETYLDEILAERHLTQEVARQRGEEESKRWQELEAKFQEAVAFSQSITNTQRFERLRKEAGLAFLMQYPEDPIWQEHEPKIDDHGYLVRKDGAAGYTSSTGYDIGNSYKQIMIAAMEAYKKEFPDDVGV